MGENRKYGQEEADALVSIEGSLARKRNQVKRPETREPVGQPEKWSPCRFAVVLGFIAVAALFTLASAMIFMTK